MFHPVSLNRFIGTRNLEGQLFSAGHHAAALDPVVEPTTMTPWMAISIVPVECLS